MPDSPLSLTAKVTNNIKSFRILKGYSQEYLATRINKSQNWLQKVECGELSVTLSHLDLIAGALEVEAVTLIFFDVEQALTQFQKRSDLYAANIETKDLVSLASTLNEICFSLKATSENLHKMLLKSPPKL